MRKKPKYKKLKRSYASPGSNHRLLFKMKIVHSRNYKFTKKDLNSLLD